MSPGPWLISSVPWSTAEHRISASSADAATQRRWRWSKAHPCLVIERRTWSAEMPVTYARFTYAADSHSVVARFEPR
jgi:GntR family histidine utilization transcriptional repressor